MVRSKAATTRIPPKRKAPTKPERLASTDDRRVENNPPQMCIQIRPLSEAEKIKVGVVKRKFEDLCLVLVDLGESRDLSLAKTHLGRLVHARLPSHWEVRQTMSRQSRVLAWAVDTFGKIARNRDERCGPGSLVGYKRNT
jgi:hypothetical protein